MSRPSWHAVFKENLPPTCYSRSSSVKPRRWRMMMDKPKD